MEIDKLNSLVELYFKKCEEVDPRKPFLKWLKPGEQTYNWGEVKEKIFKLSSRDFFSSNEIFLILSILNCKFSISKIIDLRILIFLILDQVRCYQF